MKSNALRELFTRFFEKQGHTVVPSSSLVPPHDPSLLFTNAGMVPFKDYFLGIKKPLYPRATSIQRCIRAGGKHNDLDNVGYTARHHTFFEMLGNFSFGDYFKREAIVYSWKFLTESLRLAPERLWITVFEEDEEAAAIWLNEIRIDAKRFSRCTQRDNFWAMGDTGPCGPCSEIFYDHGPQLAGGPPGSAEAEGDRYVEIWNLVFMQFQRSPEGVLTPLPKPSVDTGMGLERLAAVMQGVTNNYHTDLFQPLIKAAASQAGITDGVETSLHVIADHIRACAFLIMDGVIPSNEGRSYVLRRILRRAVRHGHRLGLDGPFLYRLVPTLVESMCGPYPELLKKQVIIERVIFSEEEQFARTLAQGMRVFEQEVKRLKNNKQLPGAVVFRLYDTYGFPIDLTADVARERGLTLDAEGFTEEMSKQRKQSKAASIFKVPAAFSTVGEADTEFLGYQDFSATNLLVLKLFKAMQEVEQLSAGEEGQVVLTKTPFYAESGGQVGDTGQLLSDQGEFLVMNTVREGGVIIHSGKLVRGYLSKDAKVDAMVNLSRRLAITANHSATHLLHAALRQTLGDQLIQRGSLVESERLRFDFTYAAPIKLEQLQAIERQVNQKIRDNLPVKTEVMSLEKAKQLGAVAIFGEKYSDNVRVLTIGNFSKELCGGTHVVSTAAIGLFKIISESGIASGVRRIQAVTGQVALDWVADLQLQVNQLARLFKASPVHLLEKAREVIEAKCALQRKIETLQRSVVSMMSDELLAQAILINTVPVLISEINGVDTAGLRCLLDRLKDKLPAAVIVLATNEREVTQLLISVAQTLTTKIKANEIADKLVKLVAGKGGGRPDFAQVGGVKLDCLSDVLNHARLIVEASLNDHYACKDRGILS